MQCKAGQCKAVTRGVCRRRLLGMQDRAGTVPLAGAARVSHLACRRRHSPSCPHAVLLPEAGASTRQGVVMPVACSSTKSETSLCFCRKNHTAAKAVTWQPRKALHLPSSWRKVACTGRCRPSRRASSLQAASAASLSGRMPPLTCMGTITELGAGRPLLKSQAGTCCLLGWQAMTSGSGPRQ